MRYYPLNYDQITWAEGHNPPAHVKSYNNRTFAYWERALFQRICSVFDFKLPDEWQGSIADFFYWVLFRNGFMCITYEDKFGYLFQPCTVYGIDLYYNPVKCVVSNPKLQKTYTIHEECEILKLTPDYMGTFDIITRFASMLSNLDAAINTNIINSKNAYLLGAKNKNAAEALKTMMDKVNQGEPCVFYDKPLVNQKPASEETPFQFLSIQKIKDNYILMELLRENQTILNQFDTEIGIPTLPYEKAERMNVYESKSKEADAISRISVWKKSLDSSLKLVKDLYPDLKLEYELRWNDNGDSENYTDRND